VFSFAGELKVSKSKAHIVETQPEPDSFSSIPAGSKRWLVGTTGTEPIEIVAETIEDAIRRFNGGATAYSRKQLTIVEG
jgi:hypothetical protein